MADRSEWAGEMGSIERTINLCVEYADGQLKSAENWTSGQLEAGAIDRAIAFYNRADRLRVELQRRS